MAPSKDAVRVFAFEIIPEVPKRQSTQYRNTASAPLRIVQDSLGTVMALRYIVELMEQFPQRFEFQWDNSWNAFGYELARRRAEVGPNELDDRILAIVVKELHRELRSGDERSHPITEFQNSYYWKEKADAFAKAAEDVLAELPNSGRRAMVAARFLRGRVNRGPRAIEILLLAGKNGALDESAQAELAEWLHLDRRYAESIPILEPLMAGRPD